MVHEVLLPDAKPTPASVPPPDVAPDGRPEAAWISRPVAPVAGAASGPLAGLRFGVKDNIDVAGLPTTAACPAFAYLPSAHATVVQRLLAAGASVSGKTNLDQFACGLNGTRSPYGAVPNSFDARYVSGGSSSGSAWTRPSSSRARAQLRSITAARPSAP